MPSLPDQIQQRPGHPHLAWKNSQAIFNTASGGIYAFVYGIVCYAFLPSGLVAAYQVIVPVLLLSGTYFLINSASMHAMMAVTGRSDFWRLWRENVPLVSSLLSRFRLRRGSHLLLP